MFIELVSDDNLETELVKMVPHDESLAVVSEMAAVLEQQKDIVKFSMQSVEDKD